MNFLHALLDDVKTRFPSAQSSISEGCPGELQISAPNPALGSVSVIYDGDEATVCVGELTHGHFNPYDASLSEDARARWVGDAVIAFLEDLMNDRAVVWSIPGHSGGWMILEPGTTPTLPEGVSAHCWSRPHSAAP